MAFYFIKSDDGLTLNKPFKTFMETNSTVETTTQPAVVEQDTQIDYKAQVEKLQADNENYKIGILKAKGKLPQDPMTEDDKEDLATRVAAKLAPELKSSLVSTVAKSDLDTKLDKLTANPDEKEAIRYHFEFSTAGEDVDARLANAQAIANKDLIAKKATEINLVKTRVTNSSSMGSSTESSLPNPADDTFTKEQLDWLEKRSQQTGIKIDLKSLKENMRLTGGMPGMFMTGAHTIHKGVNYN